MAALTNARLERYCQYRSVSGTPGGKSKKASVFAAIYPETGVTKEQEFMGLISTEASALTTRFGELGGETP